MSTKQKNGRDQPSLQRKDTTVNEAQSVAVIGGTGDLGGGLAIACARALGAKCLAVATGSFTAEQLDSYGADLVVSSLEDAVGVI